MATLVSYTYSSNLQLLRLKRLIKDPVHQPQRRERPPHDCEHARDELVPRLPALPFHLHGHGGDVVVEAGGGDVGGIVGDFLGLGEGLVLDEVLFEVGCDDVQVVVVGGVRLASDRAKEATVFISR